MRRRAFIGTLAAAPAAALGGRALAEGASTGGDDRVPAERASLDRDQWRTLACVQDHLLPSEPDDPKSPGAREVRATRYLDRVLADPGLVPASRTFILNGVGWLSDLARDRHGAAFADLDPGPREDLLRQIAESDAGERWLSELISYTLEALLADPIYGGNPGGIGWTWLGHDPGLPRPTEANRYGRLGWSARRS